MSLIVLWITGGIFWTGVALGYTHWHTKIFPNPHIFLSVQERYPRGKDSDINNLVSSDAILATHEEKLIEDAGDIKELRSDIKLMRDQMSALQDKLVAANNNLTDRINVDEAKTSTALWVIGGIFSAFHVIPVILSVAEFRNKLKRAQAKLLEP